MSREQINKYNKKNIKSSKKKEDLIRRNNMNNDDSDNHDSDSNDNDTYSSTSESEDNNLNIIEYRNLLSSLFPSKFIKNKVKSGKKIKKIIEEEINKHNTKQINGDNSNKLNKKTGCNNKHSKQRVMSEEEAEEDLEEESEEEPETSKVTKYKCKQLNSGSNSLVKRYDDYENSYKQQKKNGKVNIVLTIGNNKDEYDSEYEDESEWEDDSEDTSEDDTETEDEDEIINDSDTDDETTTPPKTEDKEENDEEVLIQLKELYRKNKNNTTIKECIDNCETKIKNNKLKDDKLQLKYKEKNLRIFKKIIKDKNTLNDFNFFKILDTEQQKKIIKELKEINKIIRIEKPYRITLLETDMPVLFKSIAIKKINSLRYIDPGNNEYYKLKNWVDTFMRIPFSNYKSLSISINDGVDKCHEFMENAQKTLNDAVYGLNDAKMQIMQMLGQLISNPNAVGSSIAIHGPPGTGKTSLIKEGISKILNRPFAFIALGGATDSSFLEGHSYTYEGSTWGKIIQILIDSKCMNPVIYFDELDKISETPKGEEIAGILTHLTDTTQNSQFHDKYFSEVDFDLSKCLFIFSYNDETKVNPILRDRMYKIQTTGYNKKEKLIISNNYLLPKIREQINFNSDEIKITDEAINYIIENNCNNEYGVRNLKRCLEIIYTKLNLYRLMKPNTNLFEKDMTLKVVFPFNVTKNVVDNLIKIRDENIHMKHLYV
jgi:ATP-dependent Lon protease